MLNLGQRREDVLPQSDIHVVCLQGGKRYITLSTGFFKDLEWWQRFADWFNGKAKIVVATPESCAKLYMDASGAGYGMHYGLDWLCAGWKCNLSMSIDHHGHCLPAPAVFVPDNINIQELYPILMAIQRWGHKWRDKKVLCFSDNSHVVSALNKGKSVNSHAMGFLRQLFWLTALYNCHLVAIHIPGRQNVIADALSRVLFPPHNLPCSYVVVEEQLCAELDSRAAEIRAHAWSVTTWKTKCSQWKKYINFCAKSASPILPTSVQTMCRYIVYLSEDLKYVTIDNYVSAVYRLECPLRI